MTIENGMVPVYVLKAQRDRLQSLVGLYDGGLRPSASSVIDKLIAFWEIHHRPSSGENISNSWQEFPGDFFNRNKNYEHTCDKEKKKIGKHSECSFRKKGAL